MADSLNLALPLHLPSAAGELPESWHWYALEALCLGIFDCPHSTPNLTLDGPLIVRSQDMRSGVFRADEAAHVSDETYMERIARAEPKYGDLLYSREGTYFGIAAEVPPGVKVCLGQRMVLIRANPDVIDFRYLRFWLNSPVLNAHLMGHRDGSVAERLNLPTIRAIPIAVPPLSEQRAIARILGALDDKIELNRRMNETLEAIARALFQSWFVDFDPVRAKAEGRQPAEMDAATAALFPDSFEESALGPIPSGWTVQSFSETISLIGGGTPKTSIADYWGGDLPWFSVVDAPSDSDMFVIDTEKKITQAGLQNSSTRLLSPGTTIISARGTVGRCALVGVPMAMNQSCYGVQGADGRGDYFTYFSLRAAVADLQRSSHGSVFDTITRDTFERIMVVCPPVELTRPYDHHISSLMNRALANLQESRTLAAIRDTLLPKLLSGAVRVGEVEKVALEALS